MPTWRCAFAEVLIFQGQPEVGERRDSRRVEQDVRGLDVAMEQVVSVRVMQRLAEDGDQFGGLGKGGPPVTKPVSQVAAIHILGHNVAPVVLGAAHVVDRYDVRVGEPGDDPGFAEVGLDV